MGVGRVLTRHCHLDVCVGNSESHIADVFETAPLIRVVDLGMAMVGRGPPYVFR